MKTDVVGRSWEKGSKARSSLSTSGAILRLFDLKIQTIAHCSQWLSQAQPTWAFLLAQPSPQETPVPGTWHTLSWWTVTAPPLLNTWQGQVCLFIIHPQGSRSARSCLQSQTTTCPVWLIPGATTTSLVLGAPVSSPSDMSASSDTTLASSLRTNFWNKQILTHEHKISLPKNGGRW